MRRFERGQLLIDDPVRLPCAFDSTRQDGVNGSCTENLREFRNAPRSLSILEYGADSDSVLSSAARLSPTRADARIDKHLVAIVAVMRPHVDDLAGVTRAAGEALPLEKGEELLCRHFDVAQRAHSFAICSASSRVMPLSFESTIVP